MKEFKCAICFRDFRDKPCLNLMIEADGKYWHNLEKVKKKDKAENAYLTKCGYKILRLSEKEIMKGEFTQWIGGN